MDCCKGHPFSLYVVSELIALGFNVSENLDEISNIQLRNETDQLFHKALHRIGALQQKALLATALFESDVNLEVIYEVVLLLFMSYTQSMISISDSDS